MSLKNNSIRREFVAAERQDFSMKNNKNTNPEYVGPGVWSIIHREAYDAQTLVKQKECIKSIKRYCDEFPCPNCRQHCQNYIRDHPLDEYINVMVDDKALGIFLWSWRFHNAVNARLKKPVMEWKTACSLYDTSNKSNICSKECSGSANANESLTLRQPGAKVNKSSKITLLKDLV